MKRSLSPTAENAAPRPAPAFSIFSILAENSDNQTNRTTEQINPIISLTANHPAQIANQYNISLVSSSSSNDIPAVLTGTPQMIAEKIEDLRIKLKAHYAQKLNIKRLFFNEIMLLQSNYIHLSILTAKQQQENIETLKQKQKQSYDELQDGAANLYGHTGQQIIEVKEIFTHLKKNKNNKILITGTAGIGKSVLSQYLSHSWAENGYGEHYKWVFRIPLRNLLEKEVYFQKEMGYRIIDVLQKECLTKDKLGLENELNETDKIYLEKAIDQQNKERLVLFILDGYDEIETLPSYLEPLLKTLFAQSQVILTSRAYNLYQLRDVHKYNFQETVHYEVTGFSSQNIQAYVNNFFNTLNPPQPEKAKYLQVFLNKNLKVQGACRIPINLELVCSAWFEQEFDESVTTISALYHAVMISLCLRMWEKQGKSINDVQDRQVIKAMAHPLAFLEYLAYQSIIENQLFIHVDKASAYLENLQIDSEQMLHQQKVLGFIRPNNSKGKYDGRSPYYFSHLTFRDFFAARYLRESFKTNLSTTFDFGILPSMGNIWCSFYQRRTFYSTI